MTNPMSMNSSLMQGLTKAADLAILNLLFILASLPVFTIGAALSALYAMLFKIADSREGAIAASFFQEFRTNLKKGAALGCLYLGIGAILTVNFIFASRQELSGFVGVIDILLGVAAMLFFMLFLYSFPLQSRFENSVRKTVENALLMSVRHFPGTLLLLMINVAPWMFIIRIPVLFLVLIPFFLLMGFSLICYINVLIFNRIFAHYIPKEEVEDAGRIQ